MKQYRVLDRNREHVRWVFWDVAEDLIERGLARTYGSRKRVLGVILLCATTAAQLEPLSPNSRKATYTLAIIPGKFIHQHNRSAAVQHAQLTVLSSVLQRAA